MKRVNRFTIVELRKVLGVEPKGFLQGFYGGSREMVTPPPTDTDNDLCILVKDLEEFDSCLPLGWESNYDDYSDCGDTFCTYRMGDYNLLVFSDATEFGAVLGMTSVGKNDNITSKEERYRLFSLARGPWR